MSYLVPQQSFLIFSIRSILSLLRSLMRRRGYKKYLMQIPQGYNSWLRQIHLLPPAMVLLIEWSLHGSDA